MEANENQENKELGMKALAKFLIQDSNEVINNKRRELEQFNQQLEDCRQLGKADTEVTKKIEGLNEELKQLQEQQKEYNKIILINHDKK